MNIADEARELAEMLQARVDSGVLVTADPRRAASSRPCILVGPPVVDYRTKLATWSLVCLAGSDAADLAQLEVMARLVEALDASPWPPETARPAPYQWSAESPPIPSYVVTITTSTP